MLDMGFAEDLEAILARDAAGAADGALLGDDAAAHRRDRRNATCRARARHDRAREDGGRQAPAGAPGGLRRHARAQGRWRSAACSTSRAPPRRSSSAARASRWTTLVENLNAHGYRAEALHGGMEQKQRDRVMSAVPRGEDATCSSPPTSPPAASTSTTSRTWSTTTCPPRPRSTCTASAAPAASAGPGVAITLAEPREHRLLRNIEAFTRQKIEVASVPTVADLRSRRLDVTRAALRERLLAGGLDDVRVVVESLAEEFDLVEIASAAVKMALEVEGGEGGRAEEEIPVVSLRGDAPRPEGKKGSHPRDSKGPRTEDRKEPRPKSGGKTSRLFVAAGRQAGLRPADLVGAITGEAGVGSHVIGSIEIGDRSSIVEVPTALATRILFALRATKIRGRKVTVNRDRGERA